MPRCSGSYCTSWELAGKEEKCTTVTEMNASDFKRNSHLFFDSLAAAGAPCSEDGDLAGFCNPVELLLSLPGSPAASLHTLGPIIFQLFPAAAAVPTQPCTHGHFNHQHLVKNSKVQLPLKHGIPKFRINMILQPYGIQIIGKVGLKCSWGRVYTWEKEQVLVLW